MGHGCNCKKLEHFTVHNRKSVHIRKSAAGGDTGLENIMPFVIGVNSSSKKPVVRRCFALRNNIVPEVDRYG